VVTYFEGNMGILVKLFKEDENKILTHGCTPFGTLTFNRMV